MAKSALKQVLDSLEKLIIKRVDAEKATSDLIKTNAIGEIADLIQESQRLKGVKRTGSGPRDTP